MTQIILVIIGILLAAAAVLMTLFFGGSAFTDYYVEAEAATLISQSSQIDVAFDLYRTDKGRLPGNADGTGAMEELVNSEYLSSIPDQTARRELQESWKVDYERGIVRNVIGPQGDSESDEVCRRARLQMGFKDEPKSCDDASLSNIDPCCVLASSDI